MKTLDAAVDREEGPTPGLSDPTSMDDGRDFLRIAEYPQMLGNTYLDHAGTTVSEFNCGLEHFDACIPADHE